MYQLFHCSDLPLALSVSSTEFELSSEHLTAWSGCILDSVFCQVPLTWLFKPPRGSNIRFAGNILTVVYDFITPSFSRRTFRISVFDIYTRAEFIAYIYIILYI